MRVLRFLPRPLRDRIIRSQVRIDEAAIAKLEVKVAETREEVEAAARIVQDAYVARGITEPHPSGVRVTPHLLLPSTVLLVAVSEGEVIGTMALVIDSPLGLPMEKTYGDEIAALRAQGRKLAEVGALALVPAHRRTGAFYLLKVLGLRCASELFGVDDIVISIHPAAEDLYRASLLFRRIGPIRKYPGLGDKALSVAMRLDMRTRRDDYFRAFGHLPENDANPYYLYFGRMPPQVRMPRGAVSMERRLDARLEASAALAAARREALEDLSPEDSAHLGWLLAKPSPEEPARERRERTSSEEA